VITLSQEELENLKKRKKELENELSEIRHRIELVEKEIREEQSRTPIPTRTEIRKEEKKQEPLAAPIPNLDPVAPASGSRSSVISSNTQMTASALSSNRPGGKRITKQVLPKGGAVSQVKAKSGKYHCPNCDSNYYEELEDKSRVLYAMGPGLNVYGKKLRCWNCGHEWPKPTD